MTDTDVDYGPDDPSDFVLRDQRRVMGSALASLDDDPEQAARSVELGKSTGDAPALIYPNLENYEQQHKAGLTASLLQSNKYLRTYIDADPMNAKLSSDDWGNLDEASAAMEKLGLPNTEATMAQGVRPFAARAAQIFHSPETVGTGIFDGVMQGVQRGWAGVRNAPDLTDEEIKNYRFGSALVQSIKFPFEVGIGIPLEAMKEGLFGGAKALAKAFGSSDMGAELFAKDIAAAGEAEAMGMTGRGHLHTPELEYGNKPGQIGGGEFNIMKPWLISGAEEARAKPEVPITIDSVKGVQGEAPPQGPLKKLLDMAQAAEPWLNDGREPPAGLHPEIDKLKFEQNKLDVDNLDEALKTAQTSATRERSPDTFAAFVRQHSDGDIGISGDAVARLYGDKQPAEGDGLLGFVPGLAEQLESAKASGGDVRVPLADWLAKVDPEVAKELHDDIRVRSGGITKAEKDIADEASKLGELVVARKMPDGSVTTGKPGQIHADLIEPDYWDKNIAPPPTDSMGFANKSGEFLSREDAYSFVKDNEPERLDKNAYKDHFQAEHYLNQGYKPAEPLPEPLPQTRAAAGLEPMFSVGDRKLELKRAKPFHEGKSLSQTIAGALGKDTSFHDFDLLDETGQRRGSLNLSEQAGGKQLYVEMIQGGGTAKMYDPNFFGPALMRDLLRQIKEQFPDAESITGHRVSGAREKAGSYELKSAMPVIKLDADAPMGWTHIEAFRQLIGGDWKDRGLGLEAYIKPELQGHEAEIAKAVQDELAKIVPRQVRTESVASLRRQDADHTIKGAYTQFSDALPRILVSLDHPDAIDVARHEAIHHLRAYGFFKPEEWATLERAARDEGWQQRFNIDKRYPKLEQAAKLEEAIADGYRAWAIEGKEINPKVDSVFQKLKDFFDALRTKFKEIFGKDLDWNEIFQKVDTGEVGSREGNEPRDARAYKESVEDEAPFDRGSIMPKEQFDLYMKNLQARHDADLKMARDRATAEQAKRQTKEWKDNAKAVREEVSKDIAQRPDVAADLFFGAGEYLGEKVGKRPKLGTEYLSAEQKAALPRDYISKDGMNPDDAANLFGYPSGDAMIAKLADYNQAKLAANMSAKDFVSRITDLETERQMVARYGSLDKSIREEAEDQAVSETQLNLLAQETLALGLQSKAIAKGGKIDSSAVDAWMRDRIDNTPVGTIKFEDYMNAAGRSGRMAEMALLKGDYAEAFRTKQQQYYSMKFAKEAKKIEKERAALDKTAKTYGKKAQDLTKSIEAEYLNHVQDILQRIGYRVARSVQNIDEGKAGSEVADFANDKLNETFGLRDIPVADPLNDPKFRKPVDELTTFEFRGIKQTIDALINNGRGERKVYREGESADLADLKKEMIDKIKEQPYKASPATKGRWARATELPKSFWAGLTSVETMFHDLSDMDARGVFNKWIVHPLFKAENSKSRMLREYSKPYRELGFDKADMDKLVEAPFSDPLAPKGTNSPWPGFTRGNVLSMLQNAGNKSNWRVLAKGFGQDPEMLMDWLVRNTKPEDWARAQKLGDMFKELIGHADKVYERINGVTVDKIPLEQITNAHGTFNGWYHPLIKDPIRRGNIPERIGSYDDANYGHITTANGYTKKRTGAVYPLDLTFDSVPTRITQMIHDINMRETILETQKIFKDPKFLDALTGHYGEHYSTMLKPYLESIAGAESTPSRAMAKANQVSNNIRQNVIGTYIGFNPSTMMKHGPTAAVLSVRQVGLKNFALAVKSLYGQSPELGLTNSEFAMKWSEELQRRERHWQDTFAGAQKVLQGATTGRERMIQAGSWLVAQSDMMSAKPTWLAAYKTAMEEGSDHGEAIDIAEQKVRFAHGTTAKVNQPGLVRGGGPLNSWLTSIYGFMGTIMQRKIETINKMNDMYHLGRDGEIKEAAKLIPSILTDIMTYSIYPVIIEEAVASQFTDDRRGLLTHATMVASTSIVNSILYLRDLAGLFSNEHDPSVGLASSPLHDIKKAIADIERPDRFSKARAGKTVGDTLTAIGHGTGMAPKTLDNAIRFGIDLVNKQAHPKTGMDYWRGISHGTTERRIEK